MVSDKLTKRFAKHKEPKLVNLRNTSKTETRREIVKKVGGWEPRRRAMRRCFLGAVLSNNDSQPRTILFPRGEVAMSGDIFVYLNW